MQPQVVAEESEPVRLTPRKCAPDPLGRGEVDEFGPPAWAHASTAVAEEQACSSAQRAQHPSHDDGATNRPLSTQDDRNNCSGFDYLGVSLEFPGISGGSTACRAGAQGLGAERPGLERVEANKSELCSGLDVSGTYSTPEPPGKNLKAESGILAIPVRKSKAPEPETIRLHKNDLRRCRDERSNAEISMSSLRSGSMLDKHAELCRARDLARIEREELRAQRREMEIEHEIAALSASHRSSKASERSTPRSRSTVRREVPIIDLTESNLRQHEAAEYFQSQMLFENVAVPESPETESSHNRTEIGSKGCSGSVCCAR